MATIQCFEDLKTWQKARFLCNEIFLLSNEGKFYRDFELKNQINASSGSIMDNIAEGFGRKGNVEFVNFLTYASGSASECKSQLYRAYDRNYITEEKRKELCDLTEEICKMITSFIIYLGGNETKGLKFKSREKKKSN